MRCLLAFSIAVTFAATGFSQTPEDTFENAPGWKWFVPPFSARCYLQATMGLVVMIDEDDDGAFLVIIGRGAQATKEGVEWRPVAFDRDAKRHALDLLDGGSSGDVSLYRFRLDPKVLQPADVERVGIEVLTKEGQPIAAREAAKRARAVGIEVLPLPRVGESFDFVLTAVDGKKLSSRGLRGKVVLIDCWATWCTPCMAKMPKLKELYREWHEHGFEVIGLSFDATDEKATTAVKSLEIPWPLVHVPGDRQTRDLWFEASGIRVLPRLLLIDRQGTLRADIGPDALKAEIEKLMKQQAP